MYPSGREVCVRVSAADWVNYYTILSESIFGTRYRTPITSFTEQSASNLGAFHGALKPTLPHNKTNPNRTANEKDREKKTTNARDNHTMCAHRAVCALPSFLDWFRRKRFHSCLSRLLERCVYVCTIVQYIIESTDGHTQKENSSRTDTPISTIYVSAYSYQSVGGKSA